MREPANVTSERGATCGSELRGCIISHHYKSKNTVVQHGNMELISKCIFCTSHLESCTRRHSGQTAGAINDIRETVNKEVPFVYFYFFKSVTLL